ncbi:BREX system Lon protease-like protein BrxL, partial [Ilumatobacter sp.]|uniref:BREX system Lon protease-like protein BrxL n=1 Tax=Ilumatobacter sp. TaxID=1967498 RepID=UPI0037507C62
MNDEIDLTQAAPKEQVLGAAAERSLQPTELDRKINEHFAGAVVRKDLVKAVKGNAIVPSYVLEYLLGQYAASDDEATIQAGIETVRNILAEHYVNRNESELVKSKIKERGRYRIIDKVSVTLNEKDDVYQATFANLGISGVVVDSPTVSAHQKLLVGGVWCLCDVEYFHTEDVRVSPWLLGSLKPIQMSNFDYDAYLSARAEFTSDEWIDLLIQSIGFDPEMFGRRAKLLQLVRLIPFVERNYNLVELGPKGTGKSHIYSEFSPHGMLISGGEVTVPKLFVNNANGRLGLVGYWDVVAFDEFAGKKKRTDKAIVDIMKNYMANKSFSRGVET